MAKRNHGHSRLKVGVLSAGLLLGTATGGSPLIHAQIMGDLPTVTSYRFGPVSMAPAEILRVAYSNVFGRVPSVLEVSFIDARTGTLVGGLKDTPIPPGTGESADFVAADELVVIAIVQLAEPRPDPLLTIQLLVNGSAVWISEPRPDPFLKPFRH